MKKVVFINTYLKDRDEKIGFSFPRKVSAGPHFPLNIVSIASFLKRETPRLFIRIFDEQLCSSKIIIKELNQIKPDIVGMSCVFQNYSQVLKMARSIKKLGAKILLGGHYATALAREILINRGPGSDDYCVDAVIKQDGEEAFSQYVKGVPLKDICNLVYRQNNQLAENPIKLSRLDDLPPIELSLVNINDYFNENRRRFPMSQYKSPFLIYSQKGCAWRSRPAGGCLFCSLMYKNLRLKSPEKVWAEIDRLISDYGVDYIWDVSDSFLSDKLWFQEFYLASKMRIKKPFFRIQARPDELIDEKIVIMLSEMNINQIFIGFESHERHRLDKIGKGTSPSINRRAISLLTKYKIPILAYFVLGLPGETKKGLAKIIKISEKIVNLGKNNLIVSPLFVPLPGSPAFRFLLKKTGRKYIGKDDINWNEATYDWIKYFCNISYREIKKTQDYLQQFPCNPSVCSY